MIDTILTKLTKSCFQLFFKSVFWETKKLFLFLKSKLRGLNSQKFRNRTKRRLRLNCQLVHLSIVSRHAKTPIETKPIAEACLDFWNSCQFGQHFWLRLSTKASKGLHKNCWAFWSRLRDPGANPIKLILA